MYLHIGGSNSGDMSSHEELLLMLGQDGGSEEGEETATPFEGNPTARREALSSRPKASGVLQFHNGVEDALLLNVERVAETGNPESVINAVDHYCYSRHWMMHVGDVKGKILDQSIDAAMTTSDHLSSKCAVELGSYCGYSTSRIARRLPVGTLLFTIESNEKCRSWTDRMLRKAGLRDSVVICSCIEEALERITSLGNFIFFLFIDHAKELYVEDLMKFENSAAMSAGCVVVADNVLSFNCPLNDYVEHVSDSGYYSSFELRKSIVEYSSADDVAEPGDPMEDGVLISVYRGGSTPAV